MTLVAQTLTRYISWHTGIQHDTPVTGYKGGWLKSEGQVTWERGIVRQNSFSNISLYIESSHKTNEHIFNFQLAAFIK